MPDPIHFEPTDPAEPAVIIVNARHLDRLAETLGATVEYDRNADRNVVCFNGYRYTTVGA